MFSKFTKLLFLISKIKEVILLDCYPQCYHCKNCDYITKDIEMPKCSFVTDHYCLAVLCKGINLEEKENQQIDRMCAQPTVIPNSGIKQGLLNENKFNK